MISPRRLLQAWYATIAVLCACVAVHHEIDGDAYWHMALGRAVLAHKSRVVPEPYAFTTFPSPITVPEWLWGVLTYALHQLGSWPALYLLSCALFAAIGLGVARLGQVLIGAAPGTIAAISGLVMLVVTARVRVRPESAGKALLALCLILSYSQVRAAAPRTQLLLGGALALCEAVWAQLHGSFVLGPPAYLLIAAPTLLRAPAPTRRVLLGTLALLCAALLSSAYGLGLLGYLLSFGKGEARLFINDMMPPSIQMLDPTVSPHGSAYPLLWIIALCGMARAGKVYWVELGLALLGLILGARSVRFFTEAAILLAPLAFRAGADLTPLFAAGKPALSRALGAAVGVAALLTALRSMDGWGQIGLAPGLYPSAAAAYLRRLPPGSNVLTTYMVGAPLGFSLSGQVRTYVDARAILHFDDTDLALSRDVFTRPVALRQALRRYDARAVVLERNREVCDTLKAEWIAVALDPLYTTFVPKGQGEGLSALNPCGPVYLPADACEGGGARLDADLARLAPLADPSFLGYLRAERIARCGGDKTQIPALLPPPRAAGPYARQRAWLLIRYLISEGRAAEALREAEALPVEDEADTAELYQIIRLGMRAGADLQQAQRLLERAIRRAGDQTPPELRVQLAALCASQGDEECVRFHGLRAAALGAAADPILTWLRQNHSAPEVRAEAAAWQEARRR
jgi:hypothetical protein